MHTLFLYVGIEESGCRIMSAPNLANTRQRIRRKNGTRVFVYLLIDIYVYTEAGSIFGWERKKHNTNRMMVAFFLSISLLIRTKKKIPRRKKIMNK
jgi:hypothetical protein